MPDYVVAFETLAAASHIACCPTCLIAKMEWIAYAVQAYAWTLYDSHKKMKLPNNTLLRMYPHS